MVKPRYRYSCAFSEPETYTDGNNSTKVAIINEDGTTSNPSYVPTAELKQFKILQHKNKPLVTLLNILVDLTLMS